MKNFWWKLSKIFSGERTRESDRPGWNRVWQPLSVWRERSGSGSVIVTCSFWVDTNQYIHLHSTCPVHPISRCHFSFLGFHYEDWEEAKYGSFSKEVFEIPWLRFYFTSKILKSSLSTFPSKWLFSKERLGVTFRMPSGLIFNHGQRS